MTTERFKSKSIIPIEAVMELGAVGVVYIREKLNDEYFDGTEFDEPRTSVPMALVETTSDKTFWKFDFDSSLGADIANYVIEPRNEALTVTKQPEVLFAYVDTTLNLIEEKIARILGLSHENIVIEALKYDENDNMILGKARTYDLEINAKADNLIGLQDKYNISQTYDCNGRLIKFIQTLDLL